MVLIYSIISLVSFLIPCSNKCWTKRWTIWTICLSLARVTTSKPKVVRDFCSKIWRLKLKGGWITFPLSCLEIFSLVLANIGYMSKNPLHKLCACVCPCGRSHPCLVTPFEQKNAQRVQLSASKHEANFTPIWISLRLFQHLIPNHPKLGMDPRFRWVVLADRYKWSYVITPIAGRKING